MESINLDPLGQIKLDTLLLMAPLNLCLCLNASLSKSGPGCLHLSLGWKIKIDDAHGLGVQ